MSLYYFTSDIQQKIFKNMTSGNILTIFARTDSRWMTIHFPQSGEDIYTMTGIKKLTSVDLADYSYLFVSTSGSIGTSYYNKYIKYKDSKILPSVTETLCTYNVESSTWTTSIGTGSIIIECNSNYAPTGQQVNQRYRYQFLKNNYIKEIKEWGYIEDNYYYKFPYYSTTQQTVYLQNEPENGFLVLYDNDNNVIQNAKPGQTAVTWDPEHEGIYKVYPKMPLLPVYCTQSESASSISSSVSQANWNTDITITVKSDYTVSGYDVYMQYYKDGEYHNYNVRKSTNPKFKLTELYSKEDLYNFSCSDTTKDYVKRINIIVSFNTSCSNYCKTTCMTACDNNCGQACITSCAWDCGSNCQAYCSSNCVSSCSGGCGYGCGEQCQGACESNCDINCSEQCQRTCTAQCTNSCTYYCIKGCANACTNSCTNGCGETCTTNCDDGCRFGCTNACKETCFDSCNNKCTTGCNNTCQKDGCKSTCSGICTQACKSSCGVACENMCEKSCFGSCMYGCHGCQNECFQTAKIKYGDT